MTESEKSVDELLSKLSRIEELLGKFELAGEDGPMDESRDMIEQTQSHLDNNRSVIPAYCLKKATEALKRLEDRVSRNSKSNLLFKFKFKPEKNPTIPKSDVSSKGKTSNTNVSDASSVPVGSGVHNRDGETIIIEPCDINGKDINLTNLSNCTVSIIGLASTVYMRSLSSTKVTVCLAARAIKIEDCRDCQFSLVCQQLRIDATHNCKFENFISARSMLESSDNLQFRQIDLRQFDSLNADEVERLFEKSKFDMKQNNWKCIDDFDWLSTEEASKNYQILD